MPFGSSSRISRDPHRAWTRARRTSRQSLAPSYRDRRTRTADVGSHLGDLPPVDVGRSAAADLPTVPVTRPATPRADAPPARVATDTPRNDRPTRANRPACRECALGLHHRCRPPLAVTPHSEPTASRDDRVSVSESAPRARLRTSSASATRATNPSQSQPPPRVTTTAIPCRRLAPRHPSRPSQPVSRPPNQFRVRSHASRSTNPLLVPPADAATGCRCDPRLTPVPRRCQRHRPHARSATSGTVERIACGGRRSGEQRHPGCAWTLSKCVQCARCQGGTAGVADGQSTDARPGLRTTATAERLVRSVHNRRQGCDSQKRTATAARASCRGSGTAHSRSSHASGTSACARPTAAAG